MALILAATGATLASTVTFPSEVGVVEEEIFGSSSSDTNGSSVATA